LQDLTPFKRKVQRINLFVALELVSDVGGYSRENLCSQYEQQAFYERRCNVAVDPDYSWIILIVIAVILAVKLLG
jgi:hypothetical protein